MQQGQGIAGDVGIREEFPVLAHLDAQQPSCCRAPVSASLDCNNSDGDPSPTRFWYFPFWNHLCFPFGNYLCRRNCLAATPNTIAHLRGQKKSRTRPDDTRAMRRLRGRDKVQLEKKLFLSDESEGNLLKINCKIIFSQLLIVL